MSKFKSQGLFNSFKNAGRGVRLSVRAERNIKIHITVATLVILTALFLKMGVNKICILIIAISNVMVAEFINTSLEFGLDAVFKNRYSRLVGMAKDIAAGAVMFATFMSIIIGIILFGENLIVRYAHLLS